MLFYNKYCKLFSVNRVPQKGFPPIGGLGRPRSGLGAA